MKPYLLTAPAESDLRAIAAWYRENRSSASARRVLSDLRGQMQQLAESPRIGKPREDLAPAEYFFWPHRRYFIIYRPATTPLQIIRIWDTARDPKTLSVRSR